MGKHASRNHTGRRVLAVGVGEKQQGLFNATLNLLYVLYRFPNALTGWAFKPSSEETAGGRKKRVIPAFKTLQRNHLHPDSLSDMHHKLRQEEWRDPVTSNPQTSSLPFKFQNSVKIFSLNATNLTLTQIIKPSGGGGGVIYSTVTSIPPASVSHIFKSRT